jgi:chromosome partitioning protein
LSSLGIALLLTRVRKLSDELESPIEHAGIVMSRVARPSYFRSQTIESLRKTFGAKVLSSVSESAAKNVPIFDMPDASAAAEFRSLGDEVLEELGLK